MIKTTDLDDIISKHNPFDKTEYYPIQSKVLCGLLGGKGMPKGSTIHIAGGSGTGKSTLVLHDLVRDLCSQGVDVAYIDADRGINNEIMKSTGVDIYYKNTNPKVGGCFLSFRKTTFAEINELIQVLADKGFKVIIIDTLAVIDSGSYLGKDSFDIENMRVGGDARPLRQLMKNINNLAEKDTRRINFILLNHTGKEIGGGAFGPPKETPKGGDAPIQYSDIIIQLYKYSSKSELYNDKPIGQKVFAEITKSRYGTGKVKTPFFIRYGKGISNILTYKEIFESNNMISKAGRTYTITLPNNETVSYVGKDNILQCIIDNYALIDSCFSEADWVIDVKVESDILDVEYSMLNVDKLPKDLQNEKIVTTMGNKVYFVSGIDITGQRYGIYYDFEVKKLYKEFNSNAEVITTKAIQTSKDIITQYLKDIEEDLKSEVEDES